MNIEKMWETHVVPPNPQDSLQKQLVEGFYRLRHVCFCERFKWEEKSADGKESDKYDPFATTAVITFDKEVVAGARLIPSWQTTPRVQELCGKSLGRTIEVSRLSILDPQFAVRHRRTLESHLIPAICRTRDQMDPTATLSAVIREPLLQVFKDRWGMRVISSKQDIHGAERFLPVELNLQAI